jgi:hypothetical protein
MDWLLWTRLAIMETLAVFSFTSPSEDTTTINSPKNTAPGHCKAFFFGSLNHQEDLYLFVLT